MKPIDSFEKQPNFLELRRIYASQAKRIVFFAGAGISALNNLPTWNQLRHRLQDRHSADIAALPRGVDHDKLYARLERVRKIPDPWDAFEILPTLLGNTLFAEEIVKALTPPQPNSVHEIIRRLWKLNIEGIITLNLDALLETAFRIEKNVQVPLATGQNFSGSSHVLQSRGPWLFHMHGRLDQRETWTFSKSELRTLLNKSDLKFALQTLFFQYCVVFVGVGATDAAIQEHLDNLLKHNVAVNTCFWLTTTANEKVFEWCRRYNIRQILYTEEEFSHEEAISAVLDGIEGAETYYEPAPPVRAPIQARDIDYSPSQLLQMEPEQARELLNGYATKILQIGDEQERAISYKEFRDRYITAINHAGLISNSPPYNKLFGHTLIDSLLGGGAFAEVYKARSLEGEEVAIKKTHQSVVHDDAMLNSFRQGVSSLQILRDANVPGVVKLRGAYEIPPVLVMEYVEGLNLQQIATSPNFDPFKSGLPILARAFKIIRDAHRLPETVLHRDIRPPNIMVRGFDSRSILPDDVVVLDFDLSWHQGGLDLVAHEKMSLAVGYLAPEQMSSSEGGARKSALVDVFGIGMTLYFCFSRNQPTRNEQETDRWAKSLREISVQSVGAWHCLGHRVSQLISLTTCHEAEDRWSADAVEKELEALAACTMGEQVYSPVFWAHELCARFFGRGQFVWNEDKWEGRNDSLPGLKACVTVRSLDNGTLEATCELGRINIGDWNRRTVGNQLNLLEGQVKKHIGERKFTLVSSRIGHSRFDVSASSAVELNHDAIRRCSDGFATLKSIVGRELH